MSKTGRIWAIWALVLAVLLGGAYAITSQNASGAGDPTSGYMH
jgi:hypothetical protein